MRAGGLGVVVDKGKDVKISIGQLVYGTLGWTEYAVVREKDVEAIKYGSG
jgi:NADPH-dependent curcumin reductase CurA